MRVFCISSLLALLLAASLSEGRPLSNENLITEDHDADNVIENLMSTEDKSDDENEDNDENADERSNIDESPDAVAKKDETTDKDKDSSATEGKTDDAKTEDEKKASKENEDKKDSETAEKFTGEGEPKADDSAGKESTEAKAVADDKKADEDKKSDEDKAATEDKKTDEDKAATEDKKTEEDKKSDEDKSVKESSSFTGETGKDDSSKTDENKASTDSKDESSSENKEEKKFSDEQDGKKDDSASDEKKKEDEKKFEAGESDGKDSKEAGETKKEDSTEAEKTGDSKSNIEKNEDEQDQSEDEGKDKKKAEKKKSKKKKEEKAKTKQILTYPAVRHGWGHSHHWGPAHIYNHDYPFFAYGYSWGCGHHLHGGHGGGHLKKSKLSKGKKHSKKADAVQCRDYVLMPTAFFVSPMHGVAAPQQEDASSRQMISKDIACNDGDRNCAQRQVIGNMAGGSLFGDGMGGLGLGFPGVPGIHTGLAGYNHAGGFGDHTGGHGGGFGGGYGGGHGGGFGGFGGHVGGGFDGGYGGEGHGCIDNCDGFNADIGDDAGGFRREFTPSGEHGFSSFWSSRNNIPNNPTAKRWGPYGDNSVVDPAGFGNFRSFGGPVNYNPGWFTKTALMGGNTEGGWNNGWGDFGSHRYGPGAGWGINFENQGFGKSKMPSKPETGKGVIGFHLTGDGRKNGGL